MKTTFKHFAFIALLFVFASVNAATYTWTGATSTDYQVATNWNPTRTTPNTTDDIIITPSSSFSVTNVPTQTINSLTINGAGINTVVLSGGSNYLTISTLFDIEANNTLDCGTLRFSAAGSNFTTSGTGTYKTANTAYNPTGKTWSFDVVYNASSLQLVAGGTYNNLTIDNSTPTSSVAAYVGGSDLTITGTLTLTRGILAGSSTVDISSGAQRSIIMNAGSTLVGGSSSSYIVATGALAGAYFKRKSVGTSALLYPLGTTAGYTPLTITNTTGNPDITVKLRQSSTNPSVDVTKAVNLEWAVSSSIATTANVTFQYNANNLGTQYDVTASNDLGNYRSSAFSNSTVGTATSIGNNNYTVSATNVSLPTTSSYYYLANTGIISTVAAPGAPTIGAATAGNAQASVTFTAPTTGGPVMYYTVTSTPGNIVGTATSSPIIVSGLTNGTAYTFTVTASNGVGTGVASAATALVTPSAVTTLLQPTYIVATPSNGQVSLAFTKPIGTVTDIKYSVDGGYNYTSAGSTTSPITITGLTNGTIYNFALLAVSAAGDGQAIRAAVVTPSSTPSAPTISGITPANGQLSVAFTAGNSGGATILNYKYSTDGGSTFTACSPAQLTSPIVINGLVNGTTYDVQIKAVNANGDGVASSTTQATPSIATALNNTSITNGFNVIYLDSKFIVTYVNPNSSNLKVKLLNLNGEVLENNVIGNQVSGSFEISSSKYAKGVYLVELTLDSNRIVKKVVKF